MASMTLTSWKPYNMSADMAQQCIFKIPFMIRHRNGFASMRVEMMMMMMMMMKLPRQKCTQTRVYLTSPRPARPERPALILFGFQIFFGVVCEATMLRRRLHLQRGVFDYIAIVGFMIKILRTLHKYRPHSLGSQGGVVHQFSQALGRWSSRPAYHLHSVPQTWQPFLERCTIDAVHGGHGIPSA